jgi:hypothetical protein
MGKKKPDESPVPRTRIERVSSQLGALVDNSMEMRFHYASVASFSATTYTDRKTMKTPVENPPSLTYEWIHGIDLPCASGRLSWEGEKEFLRLKGG